MGSNQFHLWQIRQMIVPCRVPTFCKVGLLCVVCGELEIFTHEDFAKNADVRTHVMANWTSVFIPGIAPKILCTNCAPSKATPHTTQDYRKKHNRAVVRSRANEELRRNCLFN